MKVGIAVDDWKLPVFEQALDNAGFKYTNDGSLIGDTVLLTVVVDMQSQATQLEAVVRAADRKCAKKKAS